MWIGAEGLIFRVTWSAIWSAAWSLCALVLVCGWGNSTRTIADEPPRVASSVFLTIDADLGAMKRDKRLGLLPWEVLATNLERILGIDLLAEEQIRIEFAAVEENYWIGSLITTQANKIQLGDLSKSRFMKVKDSEGQTIEHLRRLADSEVVVCKMDSVWHIGSERALQKFTESGRLPTPVLKDKTAAENYLIKVDLRIEPIRKELLSLIETELPDEAYAQQKDWQELCKMLAGGSLEITGGAIKAARLTLRGSTGISGKMIQERVQKLQLPFVDFLESYIQAKVNDYRLSQRERFAWEAYAGRLRQTIVDFQPLEDGGQLQYEVSTLIRVPLAAEIGEQLINGLEKSRLSNARFSAQYKLRELHEAIDKYTTEKGSFPLREILSEDGKSLLSWRVALLPYLGYESLYKQFHLNEPWDSPHNIQLLSSMPSIYRNSTGVIKEGETTFVAPYGAIDVKRRTVWDIVPSGRDKISEEQQSSILLIEVNAEGAVPWSSPEDLNVMQQDVRSLLRDPPEGNGIVLINGDTDYISNSISALILMELLNCSKERQR